MTLKIPDEVALTLARQWSKAEKRIEVMLDASLWPVRIKLPRPTHKVLTTRIGEVEQFLKSWRDVQTGRVIWSSASYRSLDKPLDIPEAYELQNRDEWILATCNKDIQQEYVKLGQVFEDVPAEYHELLLRCRHIVRNMSMRECVDACRVARSLTPGCATGVPLRAVSITDIDTKFIERHRSLITELMDLRYGGEVKTIGLESFIGCTPNRYQWLLVVDLDGELLSMEQMRVRDTELRERALPGHRVLIVENEQCVHLLPKLQGTLAILGAGMNLSWLESDWLKACDLGYWGDIDTWGLQMLSNARSKQPTLEAILMDHITYTTYGPAFAVPEPEVQPETPSGLLSDERALFELLLESEKGRLEQEKLPHDYVDHTIRNWAG